MGKRMNLPPNFNKWQGRRGSSDDSRRQGGFRRDTDREIAPSRADETDDWGAAKKTSAGNGFERRGREVKGEIFSPIPNLKLMNLIIGQRIKLLDPLLVEDLLGEGVLGQTVNSDSDRWTKRKEEEGGRRFVSGGGALTV
uniref:Translation initiation factor n=1 Tax=Solanum tuberosum TaxID=4113 RepID=M1DMN2_SOLTU